MRLTNKKKKKITFYVNCTKATDGFDGTKSWGPYKRTQTVAVQRLPRRRSRAPRKTRDSLVYLGTSSTAAISFIDSLLFQSVTSYLDHKISKVIFSPETLFLPHLLQLVYCGHSSYIYCRSLTW